MHKKAPDANQDADASTSTGQALRERAEEEARGGDADAGETLSPEQARRTLHDLRVHQIELEMQNEELRRAQIELDASRARYFDLYDLAPVGYVTVNEPGLILEANLTAATLLGVVRGRMVRQPISRFILKEDQDIYYLHRKQLFATGTPQACELRMVKGDGVAFWASLTATIAHDSGGEPVCRIVLSDIGARKSQEDEQEQEQTARLIVLVNTPGDFRQRMSDLTACLHGWSGCEAVGIRLRDGDDYPYYQTCGFPPRFVELENHLCVHDPDGSVQRDNTGNPVLECMCGNILCGRFDPTKPFFTVHGSFWSNNTTAPLASTTDADRQARTRNRCNGEGYESVALIPLRTANQVFGLLQFNDRRVDRFTPDLIAHFERMADSLAIALSRRHAEELLRDSEEHYRSLFENMLNGFAYCRVLFEQGRLQDFIYLKVNTAFETLTGLRNVVGKKVSQVIPGIRETDTELFEIYGRVALTGKPERFERYVEALKTWFWISVYSPAREHFVAVFDVITERKRAEEALRNSERLQRTILDNIPDPALMKDIGGRLVAVNEAWCRFTGRPRETACGRFNQEVFPPEAAAQFQEQDRAVVESRQLRHCEETLPDVHGEVHSFETFRAPVVDPAGNVSRIIGIARDITKRKQAEAARRESEAELDTIFENAPVAMLLVNGGGTVTKANRAANALAGRDSAEMTGKRGGDALRCVRSFNDAGGCGLGPACESCIMRRTVMHTFETGKTHAQVETTLTVVRGDATHEVSLIISTTMLTMGDEPMVLLCAEDVTERKRLEAQLLEVRKMEAIGRLAGGIAHDFRNQLTVVKGYGEMLLRMSLIKDGKDNLVEEILNAAERGAQLTGQLLAFSRKDLLQPSVVNLGTVVAALAGPMGRLVGEDIVISTTGGDPDLMVDLAAEQFEHAMMNLAANARDAMPRGGALTIDTAAIEVDERAAALLPDAKAGQYVRVSVRDSGAGMDPATQARLFEPFFTTKGQGKGTGLGLPMVYGFVRQSGGFITVESTPGKGTAFLLHFPRVSAAATMEAPAAPEVESLPRSDAPRGTETVLVVEDEAPIRWLVTHCLREAGYTVIETGDARQAMDAADKAGARIDMLITDVVMPGMGGVELAVHVRGRRPEIPVLFVSGYGDDVLSRRGVDLKRAELLVKPFQHAQLAAMVRRMLDATAAQEV